ncbi:SDR family oxidoreductase [soil metagenome]
MKTSGNTILLTGGSSGIGLALAKRFLDAGNDVIITGRREGPLADAKKQLPNVITEVSDSGSAADRTRLAAELTKRFPKLNVVINNAGIQRKVSFVEAEPWERTREEIAINLEAPMHMASLFIPHLLTQSDPMIINGSSGLAFVPMAVSPVYCATKAAIHSFTLSLRHQLVKTPIRVIEVIPPAVHSNLGGSHAFGVPTDEYADSVMAQLAEGRPEITYQFSQQASQGSRADLDAIFAKLNP